MFMIEISYIHIIWKDNCADGCGYGKCQMSDTKKKYFKSSGNNNIGKTLLNMKSDDQGRLLRRSGNWAEPRRMDGEEQG